MVKQRRRGVEGTEKGSKQNEKGDRAYGFCSLIPPFMVLSFAQIHVSQINW